MIDFGDCFLCSYKALSMGKFFHEDFFLLLAFLEILIVMIFYSGRFFVEVFF
jgi:hypothetical protein